MKTTRAVPIGINTIASTCLTSIPIYKEMRRAWEGWLKANGINPEEIPIERGIAWKVTYRNRWSLFFHVRYNGNPVTIELSSYYGRVTITQSIGWIEF